MFVVKDDAKYLYYLLKMKTTPLKYLYRPGHWLELWIVMFTCLPPQRETQKRLRANDCMNKILNQIEGLKSPGRIGSTQLRKYCTGGRSVR